jgi:hypothetical protein
MIQLVWLTLLAVHAGLAGLWWWIMPGGFPSSTTEYWVNQVMPPVVIIVALLALFARGKLSEAILPPVLVMIPVFWMLFGISARVTFIDSYESGWAKYFIGGAAIAALWARHFRQRVRRWWIVVVALVPAAIAGWSAPGALRAPEPSTKPDGSAFGAAPAPTDRKMVKLTKEAQLRPDDGRLVVKRGNVILNVMPMLSFTNRSPDRCWTSLAPPGTSTATNRIFIAKSHDGARTSLWYKDEDQSVLDVTTQGGAVQLDARSRLPKPIFSHANAWAELAVTGHKTLSVAFSPAPQKRIEVPSVKANARFAYVDAAGGFHVAEAAKQRRGPFTELASGMLRKNEPLTLTFYDGDKALFTVALDDWAAQASTELSPAAGWGVPQNAIELMRGGDAETTPALVSISLAATTIGQGTPTVGHSAGVYRNRMTVTVAP